MHSVLARTSLSLLIALAAGISLDSHAVSGGITGRTLKTTTIGCGSCHGATADAGMSVTITGPTELSRSQLGTYTVTATKTVTDGTRMGIDVASSDTTSLSVVAGQPTSLVSDEIVHNNAVGALRSFTGNSATYQFNYTMPALASVGTSHTLYAIAVVGPSTSGGWKNATATPYFTVTTRPVAPTSVTASGVTTASVNLAWSGTGPEYRVVYKEGAVAPINEADGTFVDLATSTSTTISGLTASTQYSFAVFSKLSTAAIFSSTAATTTATTLTVIPAPRYVDAGTGINTGVCTSAGSPCKTITYAMSQAVIGNPGDSISVAAGTYNVALGEVFPIDFKSGVQLLATGSVLSTIVDATGANKRLFNVSAANGSTVIEGFTITGGLHTAPGDGSNTGGGAMLITNSSQIKIRRNIFSGNVVRGFGGAAASYSKEAYGGAIMSSGGSSRIENNIFRSNTAWGGDGVNKADATAGGDGGAARGGAISGGGLVIVNNTFYGSVGRGGAGGSSNGGQGGAGGNAFTGAVDVTGSSVVNNIFVNSSTIAGTGGSGSPAGAAGISFGSALIANSATSNTNNLFFGNTANGDTGTSFVLADPQFQGPPTDLRIASTSPAKGAGTATGAPTVDLTNTVRPNPPSIGAIEALAAPSTFALTVSKSGSGTGTVTSSPAGISCGATCAFSFASPTSVTLTATPTSGSLFGGWTGACTGTGTCNVTMSAARAVTATFTLATDIPRLVGISTRMQVLTTDNVMIAGFIILGSVSKTVVVRARGPSLGVAGALADPTLTLVPSSGPATTNDDWGTAANAAALSASGYAPSNAKESAIMVTLAPGAYTAIVSGVGNTTGVAIAEVYELDHPEIPLAAISTRGFVQTADNVMIGGFIIQGSGPQTVVVRARGPSLGVAGALQNPTLTLVPSSGPAIVNDDWGTDSNAAALFASGFAPSDPRESAIMVTLAPGAYTAIVTGVGGTTGVAIVEVYVP